MRLQPRIRPARVGAAGFALTLLLATVASAQGPSGGPAPLSRYIPRQDLQIYIEFDGLDAHAEAWQKTAAYKILNTTPAGSMFEDLFVQLVGKIPGSKISGPDALALLKHVAKSGFVFAAGGDLKKPKPDYIAFVFRDAYKNKDVRPIAARAVMGLMFAPGAKLQSVMRAGHKVNSGPNPGGGTSTFWVEDSKKEDIVVVTPSPESPDSILEALDEKRPSVTDAPSRSDLLKSDDGFVPVFLGFVNPAALGNAPPQLGLAKVTGLDYRWGFQDDALVSMTHISAPSPRTGLLAMLDGPSFDRDSLPPIAEATTNLSVVAFDAKATVEKLIGLAKQVRPDAEERYNKVAEALKAKTKVRLNEDILARLGPKAAWYVMPAKAAAPSALSAPNMLSTMLAGAGIDQIPKGALIIEVSDSAAFGKSLDELMAYANREIKAQSAAMMPGGDGPAGGGRNRRGNSGPSVEFRLMPGETKTYVLSIPPEMASFVPASLRPTIRLGPKHVVLAINSETARAALDAKAGASPPPELAAAYRTLPAKLKFLTVSDPRETTPAIMASLPAKLQAGVNTLILQATGQPAAPAAVAANAPGTPAPAPAPAPNGGRSPGPMSPGLAPIAPMPIQPGMSTNAAPGAAAASKPAAGPTTLVLQVDSAKLPSAESIKALLFPSVTAFEVNDEGLRIVSRGAFPAFGDPSKLGSTSQFYRSMLQRAGIGGPPPPRGAAGPDGFFDVPGAKPPTAPPAAAGTPAGTSNPNRSGRGRDEGPR